MSDLMLKALVNTEVALQGKLEAMGMRPMIENPFPGVPDFTSLGGRFTELWQRIFAIGWGLAIIFCGWQFLVGLAALSKAGADDNPHAHKSAKAKVKWAGAGLAACLAFAIIIGAILILIPS